MTSTSRVRWDDAVADTLEVTAEITVIQLSGGETPESWMHTSRSWLVPPAGDAVYVGRGRGSVRAAEGYFGWLLTVRAASVCSSIVENRSSGG
jgi:hypothetical protein